MSAGTAAVSAAATVSPDKQEAENGPSDLKAVIVIHGIGRQQPFQPLDSFVNGLRSTLQAGGREVTTTHFKLGREGVFDHYLNLVARDTPGGPVVTQLDVYEFYWAPLGQGKASFLDVVRWLLVTGFTPLRRLAFNLPLVIQRAGDGPRNGRYFVGLGLEFCRELWRVAYVPLVAISLGGLAWFLAARLKTLPAHLTDAFRPMLPVLATWKGAMSTFLFAIAAIAAIAVAASLPEQIRDFVRLRKMKPDLVQGLVRPFQRAFQGREGQSFLSRLLSGVSAGWKGAKESLSELRCWTVQVSARRALVLLSVAALLVLACLLGVLGYILSPTINAVRLGLGGGVWDILLLAALCILGMFLKRIFVDYLADVALYTTADENSAFFKTRSEILKEATRKLRALLRDPRYGSVAVAGHSLGSVIGYDAINWLRVETQMTPVLGVQTLNLPASLDTLAERLPAQDQPAARELLGQLRVRLGQTDQAATVPIGTEEFHRLRTFITFGSPLNKVLYFFRTRIKDYETVRAHILYDMHGFRQRPDLLTSDRSILDNTDPPDDDLYWVNIYSPMDPISASLVFYEGVHEHRRWFWFWGQCHVSYWHDRTFYREVLAALDHKCGWVL